MHRIAPFLTILFAGGLVPLTAAQSPSVIQDRNTPRAFPAVAYRSHWETRAEEIRRQALVSCGLWPLPDKTPLRARVFDRVERDGYSIEKVYFQPTPGFYLAGNLYRPVGRGKGPFPGVLVAHGHWREGRLTDNEEASKPALGISFARQGMVAFVFDMVGYNDSRFPDLPMDKSLYDAHRMFATNRADLLWNITLMGLQSWNCLRALDFLEALPDVDRQRLAATGASGGGTQTFMLGAMDHRLAAQAPVCMVSHSMQGGCSCENAPGLRVEYSNMEYAAVAAPRPQILVAATGDWTKTTPEIEGPALAKVYELFEAKDRLRHVRFDAGHNYNQTSREAVYDWFGQWLLRPPPTAALRELPYPKERSEDLRVFVDGAFPKDALPMEAFLAAQKKRQSDAWRALVPRSRAGFARFKSVAEPLWQHSLLVWQQTIDPVTTKVRQREPAPVARGISLWDYQLKHSSSTRVVGGWRQEPAAGKSSARPALVVLAGESGERSNAASFVAKLATRGVGALVLTNYSTGEPPDQFKDFFTTYNRTKAQERVRDLVAVSQSAGSLDFNQRGQPLVVLCGEGRAGWWALLAAPAAGAVVADCAQVDITSDDVLLSPDLFFPGSRTQGVFEGAALLAAPNPLLLHNTGGKFSTDAIRAVYRALGASRNLRVESRRLSDEEIAEWIAGLK